MNVDITKLPVLGAVVSFLLVVLVVMFVFAFDATSGGDSGDAVNGETPPTNGNGTPPPPPPDGEITINMGDNFFEANGEQNPNITIPAGESTIALDNIGAVIHNMHVDGTDDSYSEAICEVGGDNNGCSDPNAVPGGTQATIDVNITEPGTYNFRCDFHPVEMVGTLTVQ